MLLDLVDLSANAISAAEGPARFPGGELIAGGELEGLCEAVSGPSFVTVGLEIGDIGKEAD